MPPQQENEKSENSAAAPATAAADAVAVAVAGASSSYWDAPPEKELEGKRLSKLDLSSLEHQHLADGEKEDGNEEDNTEEDNTENNNNEEGASYWDAPPEKGLEGKRLSKMDLSSLEHQRVEENNNANGDQSQQGMPPDSQRKSFGAYWEWQNEQFKKTLSNLSLSNLQKGSSSHPAQQGGDGTTETTEDTTTAAASSQVVVEGNNYWEWQGEKLKQTLSNLSLSNLAKGSRSRANGDEDEADAAADSDGFAQGMGPRRVPSGGSYWFWRNSSMRNLQCSSNASLTALEQAARDGDGEQAENSNSNSNSSSPTNSPARARSGSMGSAGGGGSYWFWRNGSMNNLNAASSSAVSLTALDKEVRDSEAAKAKPNEDGNSGGFPITNLQHKLRNSWRQSFQRFSTNSLRKLDEGSAVGDSERGGWMGAFSGGKGKMTAMDDSFDGGSQSSGDEDAITF